MKKLLISLLIPVLLVPGLGFANQGSAKSHAVSNLTAAMFDPAFELDNGELSLIEGEGIGTIVGGGILGGILGAVGYGTTEKDRTAGGWFVAIVMGIAGGAATGALIPAP